MQPNGDGESSGGCGEEAMMTSGLSAEGVSKWAHGSESNKTSKLAIHVQKMFNSLTAIGACERQLFDKLLWRLVTSPIFVRC